MTTPSGSFSCVLLGADTLLLECAEALRAAGNQVRAIVSSTPRIARWAREHDVRCIPATGDYGSALAEAPFDYLFAVTHLAIIPDRVLALPRKLAINFHDGPLPRYAGLNAPAWALLAGEARYGITWHVIGGGIDTGDILAQVEFDVAPSETSLSINTRCFEAAIASFGPLIDGLARGEVSRRPQDAAARSYFGKYTRPAGAAALDWAQPAAALERIVRALDFGKRYPNDLGLAKFQHGGKVFLLTRAEVRDAPTAPPGTVLALDADALVVATGEGALALREVLTVTGEVVPIDTLAARLGVGAGDRLDALDPIFAERLTSTAATLARAEGYFAARLAHLEPAEIPFTFGASAARSAAALDRRAVEVPRTFRDRFAARLADSLSIAFAATLARLTAKTEFDLGFGDTQLASFAAGLEGWVATEVPLHVAIDLAAPFGALEEKLGATLAELRGKRTYFLDLIPRRPELARPDLLAGHSLPIGVRQGDAPFAGAVLTLVVGDDGSAALHFDPEVVTAARAQRLARAFETFLASAASSAAPVGDLDLLDAAERRQVLDDWNKTPLDYPKAATIPSLFEAQVDRTPQAIALACGPESLSYRALDERANRLAHHLRALGVGPDQLVGVSVPRSVDLVVAILAVQKAGGAYVPLDPAYPAERLQAMIEDARFPVLITVGATALDPMGAKVVDLARDGARIATLPVTRPPASARPEHLAYVIYTSGSTGKPKGVMVEHRNVVNFFAGMDQRLAHDPPGVWLAVTSLSFDISVLELCYTLARGFKIVLYVDHERAPVAPAATLGVTRALHSGAGRMDFGMFLWGNDDGPGHKKYELMLESAKFADTHEFSSVWTPERHFHAFGGPFPNASVTSAALAAVTKNVRIQAGSCVAPLHHPIRIAEEWAVVDNLSNGRVAISWASGWQPDDFVLRPENYKDNKQRMVDTIATVHKLWQGEAVTFPGPRGDVAVKTLPRPVQPTLPSWITTAGNADTYKLAGQHGYNILTHLLGQTVEEVGEKIKIYRQARKDAGHDPDAGVISLMLHAFVGDSDAAVKDLVRKPMKDYLAASVSLVKNYAWAFPAFKRPQGTPTGPNDVDLSSLTPEENDAVLEFAFERYFNTSGLLGSVATCVAMVEKCRAIGVNEIACLIDFGIDSKVVMQALDRLDEVRVRCNAGAAGRVTAAVAEAQSPDPGLPLDPAAYSFAGEVERHGVTHFQCTPSMARMLLMQDDSRAALGKVRHMMVGGEALPVALGHELAGTVKSSLTNMYGPTETTIWSSTQAVEPGMTSIPIGTPIANTQLYVLDARGNPCPVGVPGELYIGGDGVVRGYLQRPELTAERFVPDPFRSGNRMYRTGDLARWREDGVVEYLGRTDFQVKIRGYRIELGEIEAALGRVPGLREAVVVARKDTAGEQQLCAYLVPDGAAPDVKQIRERLRAELPEPMVPGAYVVLDALPLTPNGKVDRRALPDPEPPKVESHADFVAPIGDIQEKLAALYKETLGLSQVGSNDNFFELGGHSLLVVRMHRRLREELPDVQVAITDLYRFPTIKTLSEALGGGPAKDDRLKATAERAARRREAQRRR